MISARSARSARSMRSPALPGSPRVSLSADPGVSQQPMGQRVIKACRGEHVMIVMGNNVEKCRDMMRIDEIHVFRLAMATTKIWMSFQSFIENMSSCCPENGERMLRIRSS